MPLVSRGLVFCAACSAWLALVGNGWAVPAPPRSVEVVDHPLDGGTQLDVFIELSPDDLPPQMRPDPHAPPPVVGYLVQRCGEPFGLYEDVARVEPNKWDYYRGAAIAVVEKCVPGEKYWFRAQAIGPEGELSAIVATPADRPAVATRQGFDGSRLWVAVLGSIVCASVVAFVLMARAGMKLKIRPIAGLEAVTEAVGRATEMGRPCLFINGIQDMNDMQTIAGLTILANVAQRNAEYDTPLVVPTSRSLVMTAARETVEAAYLVAGRPDAYNRDNIYYVSDEQFAFVSYLTGYMVREKPAACFYFGAFYAESLILAENGNAIGAIQVAGTAEPAQLPFFVAACDYTLIGEEFFAASAYLSKNPDQLGSLKGQDVGKFIVVALILVGCTLETLSQVTGLLIFELAALYVRDVMLYPG